MKERKRMKPGFIIALLFAAGLFASCSRGGGDTPTSQSGSDGNSDRNTDMTQTVAVDAELKDGKYKNVIYNKNGIRITFGAVGGQNLFEPDSEIGFFAQITGESLDNTDAKVTFTSTYLRVNRELPFRLEQSNGKTHTYSGAFSAELNGVYTLTLVLEGDIRLSFRVGVVPKNKTASDSFYFGVQPYISRAYTWGSGHSVGGQGVDESERSIFNTVEWLGCNVIREDGTVWETMQPTEESELNFTWMDRLVKAAGSRGIKLNWLLQSTPKWAAKQEYLSMTDENMYWSVCPVEEKWDKYARALAERYAKEDGILWEIWNEPDWEFFTGKPEDYLSLLERTAKIFREVNPSVYLYPGGLTVVNEPSDYRYKDSRPYFAGFRRLLDGKLINNYSVHIHGTFGEKYFYGTLEEMTRQAKEAGLSTEGIYNTEAGVFETNEQTQAEHLMSKILYTRGHGFGMYVQYSFRAVPSQPEDGWAIFDSYLQPKKAAIAYAVLIGKLGQCEKTGTVSDERTLYADIYGDGKQSVVTVFGEGGTLTLPEGVACSAYDMYGNPTEIINNTVKASLAPIYLMYEGNVIPEQFSCR